MNRRNFLSLLGMTAGGLALEQAIPFNRVWEYKRAYFQLWDSLLDDSKVRKIRAMFGDFSEIAQINIFDPDIISPNDLIEAYKRTNSVAPRPS